MIQDYTEALNAVPDDYTSVPHASSVWIDGYMAGRRAARADAPQ